MDNLLSILQTVLVSAMEDHFGEQKCDLMNLIYHTFYQKKLENLKFAKSKDDKLVNYGRDFGQGVCGFGFKV